MIKKAGIIGLGLIGGSLAKAMRARCGVDEIVAVNRSEDVLKIAHAEGTIDKYSLKIDDIFEGCDIIFICTPVDWIFNFAEKLMPYVSKDCIITDVGSTKYKLYKEMMTLGDKICYIGGHPMTGAEKFRYQASKEHLFENAYYIIAPGDYAPEQKVAEFKQLVENMGAIPVVMSPSKHDHVVAAISHVPQILASSLVNSVKGLDDEKGYMHLLAAGGFRDTTRIASSNPDMWEGICIENSEEILQVIEHFENAIKDIKRSIKNKNQCSIRGFFQTAKDYRDSFATRTPRSVARRFEIVVDVVDKPGSIAIITTMLSSNNINIKDLLIINNRERENGVILISFENEEDRKKSIKLLNSYNYETFVK